ncbi:hypothetical protein FDUTEX481_05509 [Tolypothrix sp. PCC 7601]|nr:hypothetical protein FDUTEX481_05509 [Tolypothrix sp. PCC 7601]
MKIYLCFFLFPGFKTLAVEIVDNFFLIYVEGNFITYYLWKTCGKTPQLFHKVYILN